MAHNIGQFQGQNTIAYFGQLPWHRLGHVIPFELLHNIPEVMKLAGLDWTVKRTPLYHAYDAALDSKIVQNPFAYGVVRIEDGQIISSVGRDTELVQNIEAFGIVEPLIKEFGFTIEVAGSLGVGEQVWLALKAPGSFELAPGDPHDIYFTVRHFHTNGGTTEGYLSDVRQVCANTIGMAIGKIGGENVDTGRAFRIKKTAGVRERIEEAKILMKNLGVTIERTKEGYRKLYDRKLTPEELAQFIAGVFPLPTEQKRDAAGEVVRDVTGAPIYVEKESKVITERRKTVANLVYTSPGAELAGANIETGEANAWAVLNSVSHYFDHVRVEEAKSEPAKRAALVSTAFGQNNATKLLALSRLRDLSLVAAG